MTNRENGPETLPPEGFSLPRLFQLKSRSEQAIRKRANAHKAVLSERQQAIWMLGRTEGAGVLCHRSILLRLDGGISASHVVAAFRQVLSRHEVLRTTFIEEDGEPWQVIHEIPYREPLCFFDLGDVDPGARERVLRRCVAQNAREPFRFGEGPLLRTLLCRCDDTRHYLAVTFHEIVADCRSCYLFSRELASLYAAVSGAAPPPPSIAVQYADYAEWQRPQLQSAEMERKREYWQNLLADDRCEGLLWEASSRAVSAPILRAPIAIPAELVSKVRELGRREAATPFMIYFAALEILLSCLTSRNQWIVGTSVSGRNRPETANVIGLFATEIAIRATLDARWTMRELLASARQAVCEAFANQEVGPLPAARSNGDGQRKWMGFEVMFDFNGPADVNWETPGLTITREDITTRTSATALDFRIAEAGGGLRGSISCGRGWFDESVVNEMPRHYEAVIELLVNDGGRRLADFSL